MWKEKLYMSTGLQFLPWDMAWTQLKLYYPLSCSINSASIFVQVVISKLTPHVPHPYSKELKEVILRNFGNGVLGKLIFTAEA